MTSGPPSRRTSASPPKSSLEPGVKVLPFALNEQRNGMLKAATLLVGAVQSFDRNQGFPPRHYDPENPQMTVPADPSRSRTWRQP